VLVSAFCGDELRIARKVGRSQSSIRAQNVRSAKCLAGTLKACAPQIIASSDQ
jgi:hypothetical protein